MFLILRQFDRDDTFGKHQLAGAVAGLAVGAGTGAA